LISPADLEILQSFKSNGHVTLSAYLRLDTPKNRESAYDDFVLHMRTCLEQCRPQPECRQALLEDQEIVRLYLGTNGHRHHTSLAIFSCAAEFFWRAYPLFSPVDTQVSIGSGFDVEPLKQLLG
jgi:hypothetical protein